MDYKIGSFNTKNLSFISNKDVKKNFEKMGDFLKKEDFDIIALQEVMNPSALERLVEFMGSSLYDKRFEQSRSKSKDSKEGYAFIWNTKRIELARKSVSYNPNGEPIEPRIVNQYRTDPEFRSQGLIRNPYYGRFTPLNCPACEIRLINTHIMYGKSAALKDLTDYAVLAMRKKELEILTTQIYRRIADDHMDSCKPNYTFLLGDYNMNLETSAATGDRMQESISIDDNGHVMEIYTVQDQLTTLCISPAEDETFDGGTGRHFKNNYDHFSYAKNKYDDRGLGVKVYHINAVSKHLNDDYAEYNKTISDHIPIAMELSLR